MTQQLIELGSGPDSNTGDSLYVAFTKTNDNFSELYTLIGGGNNLTGNLVTANNFYTTGNLRVGNIRAFADIFTVGNVIASGYYYPNGTPAFGPGSLSSVSGDVLQNVAYDSDTGNLTISTPDTDYVVDIGVGRTDDPTFNSITVTGNVTAGNVNILGSKISVDGIVVVDDNAEVVTAQLKDSGVIVGTYGNSSAVPVITVDSKGRVTFADTQAVAGVNNVQFDSNTGNLTLSTSAGTEFVVGPIASTTSINEFRQGIQEQIDNLVLADIQYAQIDAQVANAIANIAGVTNVTYDSVTGNLTVSTDSDDFVVTILGNASVLGDNTEGQLISNAVNLTSTTSVTDGLALLNEVLGKLVPSRPPYFPNNTTISINGLSSYRMTNFVQTDNTASGNNSVAGGTVVSSIKRSGAYLTNSVENVGPGESGILSLLLNGSGSSSAVLNGSSDGVYGSLAIYDNQDYHNVVDSVATGFWSSFSTYASGIVSPGWNELYIIHSQAGSTNTATWYYDNSGVGAPIWSNASMTLATNVSSYSSTIPHLTSASQFQLTANVSKLSGDTYPLTDTFVTGTAGGALTAPQSITYASAGIATPLERNLYVTDGSAYISTTASVKTGFGSSTTGPSLTAQNSYNTGVQSFTPSATILYKTGTGVQIEETSIPVNGVGIGAGTGTRVINPGNTDTPSNINRSLFNSQNSTLEAHDATVVAAILKHDTTNYSTGFIPVGPDLSVGRSGDQYFTFKFTRTTVSKFDIKYTGTVAGIWVALPGSAIDSTSGLNGWLDMTTSYNGSGLPGVNGLGNGSNGCAVGGTVQVNVPVTNVRKTATFGTESSSNTTNNEIFVRIKLTSGQSVSAISIETATN